MAKTLTFVPAGGLREALDAFIGSEPAKDDLPRDSMGAALNVLVADGFRARMLESGVTQFTGAPLAVLTEAGILDAVPAWIDAIRGSLGLAGRDGLPSRWTLQPVSDPRGFHLEVEDPKNIVRVEG